MCRPFFSTNKTEETGLKGVCFITDGIPFGVKFDLKWAHYIRLKIGKKVQFRDAICPARFY